MLINYPDINYTCYGLAVLLNATTESHLRNSHWIKQTRAMAIDRISIDNVSLSAKIFRNKSKPEISVNPDKYH